MYPKEFQYHRATSFTDLFDFLEKHEESRILAGGQSLIPMMKLRIASPRFLIDIRHMSDLKLIKYEEGKLKVGSMVTHSELIESQFVNEKFPLLSQAASSIGDLQVRTLGTVGGSICHADPSADYLPALVVLRAELKIRNRKGTRIVPVRDFIKGALTTDLDHSEVLEEVLIPSYKGRSMYEKFSIRKADFSIANVAAILDTLNSKIRDVRIAVGSQEEGAVELFELEQALNDKEFSLEALEAAAKEAVGKLNPLDDIQGSPDYRRHLMVTLIVRMTDDLYHSGRKNYD